MKKNGFIKTTDFNKNYNRYFMFRIKNSIKIHQKVEVSKVFKFLFFEELQKIFNIKVWVLAKVFTLYFTLRMSNATKIRREAEFVIMWLNLFFLDSTKK